MMAPSMTSHQAIDRESALAQNLPPPSAHVSYDGVSGLGRPRLRPATPHRTAGPIVPIQPALPPHRDPASGQHHTPSTNDGGLRTASVPEYPAARPGSPPAPDPASAPA